jgi:hypothetical protein
MKKFSSVQSYGYVNIILIIVILILVIYCLVTSNKENFIFMVTGGGVSYPFEPQPIIDGLLSDSFYQGEQVLNDEGEPKTDENGEYITKMVSVSRAEKKIKDAGKYINYTKDEKVYTSEQDSGDSVDHGTLVYDNTLKHPIIIPPKNKIPDRQEFLQYRLNNMPTESTMLNNLPKDSTNMYNINNPMSNNTMSNNSNYNHTSEALDNQNSYLDNYEDPQNIINRAGLDSNNNHTNEDLDNKNSYLDNYEDSNYNHNNEALDNQNSYLDNYEDPQNIINRAGLDSTNNHTNHTNENTCLKKVAKNMLNECNSSNSYDCNLSEFLTQITKC